MGSIDKAQQTQRLHCGRVSVGQAEEVRMLGQFCPHMAVNVTAVSAPHHSKHILG